MSPAIANQRLTEQRSVYLLNKDSPVDIKRLYRSYLAPDKKSLTPSEVHEIVSHVAASCASKKEMSAQVDFLAKTLTLKLLEEAVCLNSPNYKNVEEAAQCFSHEAIQYLKQIQFPQNIWVRNPIRTPIYSFCVALESFLKSLGLIDLFKPVISSLDVETKGQQLVLLSTLFSTLTTTLIPLLGPLPGGFAIGGLFLSLVALSALHPFWRPLPNYLPKIENWTEKCAMGALETGDIRRGLLDQIIGGLKSSKQDHLQVMLIGKPGVGKTELVKTLVQAIENGDYPEFRGFQVFYINTADLLSNTEWVPKAQSILSFISEAIEGHRNKMIFVFNQIHMVCKPEAKSYVSEQLNTMLDRAKECFPHVIGITTEEDFRSLHKDHPCFSGRFRCIPVTGTSSEETLHILRHTLLKLSPETLVDDQTLHVLLEKTLHAFGSDALMPKTAVRILSQCIQRSSDGQKTSLRMEVDALQRRLETAYCENALGSCSKLCVYEENKRIRSIQSELREKQEKLSLERGEVSRLFQRRQLLLEAKKITCELALKVSSGNSEKEKKTFLIFTRFLCPSLENELHKQAYRLGVKVGIDASLIDQVIAEEIDNQKKLGLFG